MTKKILITFLLVLTLCSPVWASVENFTTGYTETDPSSHLEQTATRSTWSALTFNENAYLDKNGGVSFTGDWDIVFDFNIPASGTEMGGSPGSRYGAYAVKMDDGTIYIQAVRLARALSSKVFVDLFALELGGGTSDQAYDETTLSLDTTYYARYRRVEAASTNGTLYLDIYGSSANRASGTSALVSLSLPITVMGKVDMTALNVPFTADLDLLDETFYGYIENLDLTYVPPETRRMINIQ